MSYEMKNLMLSVVLAFVCCLVNAQNVIKLARPDMDKGSSTMKAIANRSSCVEFNDKRLSLNELSSLLWAANGINRPESGKRTAASAMNKQDIDIYVFTDEHIWLYVPTESELRKVADGDNRQVFGEAGMAPVILLLVSDVAKFGDVATPEERLLWGAMDAGIVSQNIAIFCSANGLGTRPRAWMKKDEIRNMLGLSELQVPMLNMPVGFSK